MESKLKAQAMDAVGEVANYENLLLREGGYPHLPEVNKESLQSRLRANADIDEAEGCTASVVALEREAADRIEQLEQQLEEAKKEISDEQIDNIIFQCDGYLKWGVGEHGKQTIREKIRGIIKESSK